MLWFRGSHAPGPEDSGLIRQDDYESYAMGLTGLLVCMWQPCSACEPIHASPGHRDEPERSQHSQH